jgi:hypothetical protein
MDGRYLASNIGQLKIIGDGKVFVTINDLLNSERFIGVELVAYEISGSDKRIVTVNCLLKRAGREVILFRRFDFYKATRRVEDDLKLTADYGIGIGDFDLISFSELRNWYLQSLEIPAEAIQ